MKHCPNCGSPIRITITTWPHQCDDCKSFHYNSPKPVVNVFMMAATDGTPNEIGGITVRRGIEPFKGELALPGGYIDHGESWQDAACREVLEETGIVLEPDGLTLRWVRTRNNFLVMAVSYNQFIHRDRWENHDLTLCVNDMGKQEVTAIQVSPPTTTLGIPIHNDFWQDIFGTGRA